MNTVKRELMEEKDELKPKEAPLSGPSCYQKGPIRNSRRNSYYLVIR